MKEEQDYKTQRFQQPGPVPRSPATESRREPQALLTMSFLETGRHFWTKTQAFTFFAIVFVARVLCAYLNSGPKHVPLQFSYLVTFSFLLCRLQAGNWKMGHRKPGLLHLSHFVIAALVSFCFVCQLGFNPQHDSRTLLSGRTLPFFLPKKTH